MDFDVAGAGADFSAGSAPLAQDVEAAPAAAPTPEPAAAERSPQGFSGDSSFEPARASRPPVELNPALTPSQQIEAVRRSGLPEELRGPADKPQAEYRTVTPDQQRLVDMEVKARLTSDVNARNLPPDQRARLQGAIDAVGTPDFYKKVAELDPKRASAWNQMADVQQGFRAGEAGYDPKTRAYSESMRLTLHAAAVQHLADPSARGGADLYSHFVRLHTTAFNENGGWVTNNQLGLGGAGQVLANTPLSMGTNAHNLIRGTFQSTDPLTARAAEMVRTSRWSVLNGAFDAM